MAASEPIEINMPDLPARHGEFIKYLAANLDKPVLDLVEPYKQYDAEMRKVFAQRPDHPATGHPNVVPVFEGHEENIRIRGRNLKTETNEQKESYIMPLKDEDRRSDGSPAVVQSLKDFRTNFNVFSESSLVDLDWSNVVAAGSSVVTSLLAVPQKHGKSKRALREYYHGKLAPASDVDLFIYGLNEEQAKEKIKQIERNIRDAILVETTTVRTKNAITIASQYPTRHVQIVLRIYKSISEILTGFDVDCSCAAYDGHQVYASPRALAAYMTQINTIDLTRRSPSYENRLSKYAHRGFEVYWPKMDRSRIDPTIFERSFGRTEGLARLLILEKLPKSGDRDAYLDQRRAERGRPAINRWRMQQRMIRGNIKNDYEDEVAEWVDAEEVSDYHTFTVPYGPKFHAKKIEKLLYTKDLLLNAEWNKPKDREVTLHRHPAFFGRAEDVFHDCCGYCPQPSNLEEEEVAEEESKIYISGKIGFIKDDPGRQTIGSFNPITADDWTEMAYVGNTELLCKAIVDGDLEYVQSWLQQEGNDPNTRDYTGRTPLHLAVANSSSEVVQSLIDHGARLVARLVDGKTALHLAAMRGSVEIVSALLRKSEANEEEEERKVDARRAARKAEKGTSLDEAMKDANISEEHDQKADDDSDVGSDVDMLDDANEDDEIDATTESSMINIRTPVPDADEKALDDEEDADVFDVNVLAWDVAVSPLHLAIVNGHVDVVKTLVQDFGADVLLPVKLYNDFDKSARAAILTLVLALQLPMDKAKVMTQTLISLGASSAQADIHQNTAFHYCVADFPGMLPSLMEADKTGVSRSINHLAVSGAWHAPTTSSSLMAAIRAKDTTTSLLLLANGSKAEIDFASHMKAFEGKENLSNNSRQNKQEFEKRVEQPIISAVRCELPDVAIALLEEHKVDPSTLALSGYSAIHDQFFRQYNEGCSLLDEVRHHVEELKTWTPKEDKPDPPLPLQDDSVYLSGLQEGSYAWWSAQKQLKAAKERYKRELKSRQEALERASDQTGALEKQEAISNLQKRFEQLEAKLVELGAKTFQELHPDIPKPDERPTFGYNYKPWKPDPFSVDFRFNLPALTEEAQDRYMKLFEAAWKADLKTVKELTLLPWKDSTEEDRPPLTIAVQDQHNLSPFGIAILNGQFELASAIMKIADAQYVQPDGSQKKERFRLDGGHDEESDLEEEDLNMEDDEHGIRIRSELVDEQFTIENIGEVSTQVKTRTLALAMLNWSCPAGDFIGGPLRSSPQSSGGFSYFGPRRQTTMAGKRTNTGSLKARSNHLSDENRKHIGPPSTLIQFALHNDDQDLLAFLLEPGEKYTRLQVKEGDEDAIRYFAINDSDYLEAIHLDRPHLVTEIIKRTGAGIPLNRMIKKSGVEVKEKPKYYQGLSVYGKKRKDWADAGRNEMNHQVLENHRPGLLQAAWFQSLETVEWFLRDGPMRSYLEFARAHQADQRVRLLSEAKWFEASVSRFLNARSKLAIHCCLMGKSLPESIQTLQFLVKTMPKTIDARSSDGIAPLHIAFQFYQKEAAKVLIDAGALQTARDRQGSNLLHYLLKESVSNENKLKTLSTMIDLIDKRILSTMFIERSAVHPGSLTPLAQWVHQLLMHNGHGNFGEDVLRTILDFSEGEELNMINGEGHTPLHVGVRENNDIISRTLLKQDPTLLLRENALGRTPFEMAEDSAVVAMVSEPAPLPGSYQFQQWRTRNLRLNSEWHQELVSRSPSSFVEDSANEDRRSSREQVCDLVREVRADLDARNESKRKLVTLNEANEVARRLAASESGRLHRETGDFDEEEASDGEQDEQDGRDEVQLWLPQSRSHLD